MFALDSLKITSQKLSSLLCVKFLETTRSFESENFKFLLLS